MDTKREIWAKKTEKERSWQKNEKKRDLGKKGEKERSGQKRRKRDIWAKKEKKKTEDAYVCERIFMENKNSLPALSRGEIRALYRGCAFSKKKQENRT